MVNGLCSACERAFQEGRWVCGACGRLRENPVEVEDQRRALRELHEVLSRLDSTEPEKNARLWQNAFFPTQPDVLVEEVLWARGFFEGASSEAALERAEGALTRLELGAVMDADSAKKLAVLRKLVDTKRKRDRREIVWGVLLIVALAGILVAFLAWIVGRIFPAR